MSDGLLPNDTGVIPPLPQFPSRNSGSSTPVQRTSSLLTKLALHPASAAPSAGGPSAPHKHASLSANSNTNNSNTHASGNETPSPRLATATSGGSGGSRRSSLTQFAGMSALAAPQAAGIHSKPGTPLSHARSILRPDDGSPSRTPQLAHGSLLKHEHSLPSGELTSGPSGVNSTPITHHRRKSSAAMSSLSAAHLASQQVEHRGSGSQLLSVSDDPNRPPPTLLGRRNSRIIQFSGVNASFKQFLSKHTVQDLNLTPSQKVIEVDGKLSPAEGFEILLKANILSAPVVDPHPAPNGNRYTGFLDVRDLVSSIIFAHEESQLQNAWTESFQDLSQTVNKKFSAASTNPSAEAVTAPNVTLTYLSRRNPFKPVLLSDTLLTVARAMSNQLHRVPVVDPATGQCIAIISQSSIVQYFIAHKAELESEMKQSLAQLSIGLCRVISCASDLPTWNAFKLLEVSGVSGIAVVDAQGKLCANTSARDLKLFVLNRGSLSLDVSIIDYLSQIRQRSDVGFENHPSCSVGLSSSIGHVMSLMHATKYHRVFIVDGLNKPIGVLSVTDILRFACADHVGALGGPASGGSGSNSGSHSNSLTAHQAASLSQFHDRRRSSGSLATSISPKHSNNSS